MRVAVQLYSGTHSSRLAAGVLVRPEACMNDYRKKCSFAAVLSMTAFFGMVALLASGKDDAAFTPVF